MYTSVLALIMVPLSDCVAAVLIFAVDYEHRAERHLVSLVPVSPVCDTVEVLGKQ